MSFFNPVKRNQWVVFTVAWSLSESFMVLLLRIPRLVLSLMQKLSPLYLRIIMDSMVPSKAIDPAFDSSGDQGFPLENEIQIGHLSFLSYTPSVAHPPALHASSACPGSWRSFTCRDIVQEKKLDSSRHIAFIADLCNLINSFSSPFGGQGQMCVFPTLSNHTHVCIYL